LNREIINFLDKDAIIVLDGAECVAHMERWVKADKMCKVLPIDQLGSMGPGMGRAIGAQAANPGKQVLLLNGDGAFGIGGIDLECASRYKLPLVTVVSNNSGWLIGRAIKANLRRWEIQKGMRYDKMAEGLNCHAENVERPEDIRPALERAFASGRTALINCVVDQTAVTDVYGGAAGKLRMRIF